MSFGRLGSLGSEFGRLGTSGRRGSSVVPGILSAGQGAFALTGNDASLLVARTMIAAAGAFAMSGQAAILTVQRNLAAGAGSFAMAGQDATLTKATPGAFTLAAGAGAFVITGDAMTPLVDYKLPASAGSFAFTGQDATLTKTGGPSYGFRNSSNSSGGNTHTASIDLGTASEDRLVIIGVASQYVSGDGALVTSVTANGVTLNEDAFALTFYSAGMYSGIVSSGDGTNGGNNIVVEWSDAIGADKYIFVWTATGLSSNVAKHAGTHDGTPGSINVDAGDFLFAVQYGLITNHFNGSTETPFAQHNAGGNGRAADWTILAPNASFQIVDSSGGADLEMAFASYR